MAELTEKQQLILYNLAIRQDEQGRETTHIMMSELETSDLYQDLFELEYLTYATFGEGEKAIAQIIVTLKGERYCHENIETLSALHKETWQMVFN